MTLAIVNTDQPAPDNDTTLQDLSDLAIHLMPGETVAFECHLKVGRNATGASSPDIDFSLSLPEGASGFMDAAGYNGQSPFVSAGGRIWAKALMPQVTAGWSIVRGLIVNGETEGDAVPQFGNKTAVAGQHVTVLAETYIKA